MTRIASASELQDDPNVYDEAKTETLIDCCRQMISTLGEDVEREGLINTPYRVAKAMQYMLKGYGEDPDAIIRSAIFKEERSQMVVVKDIEFYSLCEHHLLPFFGKAHVAYIANGSITGLSKLPRVVDCFARRLQVQERMTSQIRECIERALNPLGVAVIIEAQHLCMQMRGVEKRGSVTVTTDYSGELAANTAKRDELFSIIGMRSR